MSPPSLLSSFPGTQSPRASRGIERGNVRIGRQGVFFRDEQWISTWGLRRGAQAQGSASQCSLEERATGCGARRALSTPSSSSTSLLALSASQRQPTRLTCRALSSVQQEQTSPDWLGVRALCPSPRILGAWGSRSLERTRLQAACYHSLFQPYRGWPKAPMLELTT